MIELLIWTILQLNFNAITSNSYSNTNSTTAPLIATFNDPIAAYLIVLMAVGITYYYSDENMNIGLIIGETMTLFLYAIGIVYGVALVTLPFVLLMTFILIFYFGLTYFKPKNENPPMNGVHAA